MCPFLLHSLSYVTIKFNSSMNQDLRRHRYFPNQNLVQIILLPRPLFLGVGLGESEDERRGWVRLELWWLSLYSEGDLEVAVMAARAFWARSHGHLIVIIIIQQFTYTKTKKMLMSFKTNHRESALYSWKSAVLSILVVEERQLTSRQVFIRISFDI